MYPVSTPRSYEDVYQEIIQLQKGSNTITLDKFNSICSENGITAGGERSLLDYLHKTGVVVYFDRSLLKNTVYINPDWLTSEVYKLINNKLRAKKGEIDYQYLEEILPGPEYDESQRLQFIELLKNFHLIFEEEDPDGKEIDETVFIAPQYLPEKLPRREQTLFDTFFEEMTLKFIFRFPRFIPDNVMINFLSRYGPYSNKMYWKNGICFKNDKKVKCAVKYDEANKTLKVYSEDKEETHSLLKEISDAFTTLSKNANAEVSIDGGTTFVSVKELKTNLEACRNNPDHSFYPSSGGSLINVKDYFHLIAGENYFGRLDKISSDKDDSTFDDTPSIYISYAWDGDSEKIVNQLDKELQAKGVTIIRDKRDLDYRGSIKNFMEDIGRGNKVIVVLSKKYLKSYNCMFELSQIYENKDFQRRIFPIVLEDSKIYDTVKRAKYIKFWDKKIKALDKVIKSLNRGVNVTELQKELNEYARIRATFDRMAFVLKDMNALNPEEHQNENFDSLYKALIKRTKVTSRVKGGISSSDIFDLKKQLSNVELALRQQLQNGFGDLTNR
ncbi:MAG: hypothetical protein ACJASM_002606, partial [Salibacteraceae bacterium]